MKHQISPIPLTRDRKFSIGVVLLVLYSGFLALKKIYIRCGSPRHSYKSLHRVSVQWKEGQKHQVGTSDKAVEKSQTRTMVRTFDLKLDLFAEHLCCNEKCKSFLALFQLLRQLLSARASTQRQSVVCCQKIQAAYRQMKKIS